MLSAIRYPNKGTGSASSSEQETFKVSALGERIGYADRNGTTHSYDYDVLGWLTADDVTGHLGSGLVSGVTKLGYTYNTQGLPYQFTSYNSSSSVVNQVQREYNGLGQLVSEYQAHSGAVNTSNTPKVQYAYSALDSNNRSRLTSMTYPNGRTISYNYAGGLDSAISRLSSISDASATLESYSYLGLDTVVKRTHPQPAVDLTYIRQTGESDGEAGDQYTGLDCFGRIVDQRWIDGSGTALDRYQYGYDRDGNPLYKLNAASTSNSELYSYDDLNRLSSFGRGTLNSTNTAITGNPSRSQSWTLDALGNWSDVTTDGNTEYRDHDKQNEITALGEALGIGYDGNGNFSSLITGDGVAAYLYDAWNHLAYVDDSIAGTTASYGFDALGRRITETSASTTDLYYSSQWQVIEEQSGGTAKAQYVWSPVYVDAMIERDRDADENSSNGLEQRLYATHDANYNVTGLVDTSGAVVERYQYDPYGSVSYLTPSWGSRSVSSYTWQYLHQGGRFDIHSGLYNFRNRDYSPMQGRWMQQDPLRYVDGANLYHGFRGNPIGLLDPNGTITLPNPEGPWGPIDPVSGQPTWLPKIPGGWKPVGPSRPYDPSDPASRPGRWAPIDPAANKTPKGGQPSGSWDPVDNHGDFNDGTGGPRQRFDKDGNPISPDEAHPKPPTPGDGEGLPDPGYFPGLDNSAAATTGGAVRMGIGLGLLAVVAGKMMAHAIDTDTMLTQEEERGRTLDARDKIIRAKIRRQQKLDGANGADASPPNWPDRPVYT